MKNTITLAALFALSTVSFSSLAANPSVTLTPEKLMSLDISTDVSTESYRGRDPVRFLFEEVKPEAKDKRSAVVDTH